MFLGNRMVTPSGTLGELDEVSNTRLEPIKAYAWSRGLGIEYSPIKMRITRKKQQEKVISTTVVDPSTVESGALRVVKALAREK
jgi:hypothetical protein